MSNMSYCRFHNTASDFDDCVEHFGDVLSDDEREARRRLLRLALRMVADYADFAELEGLADAAAEAEQRLPDADDLAQLVETEDDPDEEDDG